MRAIEFSRYQRVEVHHHRRLASFLQAAEASVVQENRLDADAVSKILALESAWNQAVETRDTKALNAIFDNFLVYVEHDGRAMSKAEGLATVKRASGNLQQVTTEGMTANIWGGECHRDLPRERRA